METPRPTPRQGATQGGRKRREPGPQRANLRDLRALPGVKQRRREALVLLHPFGLCSDVWEPLVPRLQQHHEVFAFAIPGHAGSEPVPPDYRHTISACVDMLEAKLEALGIARAHMVGC